MYRSLSPGAVGVAVESLEAGLALAARHGFAGYHFSLPEVARLGVDAVRELVDRSGVRLAACGLPLDFRGAEEAYRASLQELPALAAVARQVGVDRCSTWIAPGSDELTFAENLAFHAQRLRPAAAVLADSGVRLGLEYVAPRTSWEPRRHRFITNQQQMAELCQAVGPNAGYLLDSWHWHCAGESVATVAGLAAAQVVDVHVNDAPAGIPTEALMDLVRELPGETGVIDIAGFLGALRGIGYDGPVMVEPFSKKLRGLDAETAVAATAAALDRVWRLAGL